MKYGGRVRIDANPAVVDLHVEIWTSSIGVNTVAIVVGGEAIELTIIDALGLALEIAECANEAQFGH